MEGKEKGLGDGGEGEQRRRIGYGRRWWVEGRSGEEGGEELMRRRKSRGHWLTGEDSGDS